MHKRSPLCTGHGRKDFTGLKTVLSGALAPSPAGSSSRGKPFMKLTCCLKSSVLLAFRCGEEKKNPIRETVKQCKLNGFVGGYHWQQHLITGERASANCLCSSSLLPAQAALLRSRTSLQTPGTAEPENSEKLPRARSGSQRPAQSNPAKASAFTGCDCNLDLACASPWETSWLLSIWCRLELRRRSSPSQSIG